MLSQEIVDKINAGRKAIQNFEESYAQTDIKSMVRPMQKINHNEIKTNLETELQTVKIPNMDEFLKYEKRMVAFELASSFELIKQCDCCTGRKPFCKWVSPIEPRIPLPDDNPMLKFLTTFDPVQIPLNQQVKDFLDELIWSLDNMQCATPKCFKERVPYFFWDEKTQAGRIFEEGTEGHYYPDCAVTYRYFRTPQLQWRW